VALAEIWNAEVRLARPSNRSRRWKPRTVRSFSKAVAKITDDPEELLAFYDFDTVRDTGVGPRA
jgi:hypothetical protein